MGSVNPIRGGPVKERQHNMAWKGNSLNPSPNTVKEPIARSEKFITEYGDDKFITNDRASEVRRDKDTQKNFTISLYDIDEAILTQLQRSYLLRTSRAMGVCPTRRIPP